MIITHHGLEFFKITQGDLTIAYNPVSKSSKYKPSSFGADLVLISLNDEDFNGSTTMSRGDKEPFVISGPGEYEYKGIFVRGFPTESNYKDKKRINSIYTVTLEDMTLCFLGALSQNNLKEDIKKLDEEIDVLFLPIGADILGPSESYKLAVSLEPKIIIPMHYDQTGDQGSLKIFLKEEGGENLKPIDKLTLKKKDLVGKEGEIIILRNS